MGGSLGLSIFLITQMGIDEEGKARAFTEETEHDSAKQKSRFKATPLFFSKAMTVSQQTFAVLCHLVLRSQP